MEAQLLQMLEEDEPAYEGHEDDEDSASESEGDEREADGSDEQDDAEEADGRGKRARSEATRAHGPHGAVAALLATPAAARAAAPTGNTVVVPATKEKTRTELRQLQAEHADNVDLLYGAWQNIRRAEEAERAALHAATERDAEVTSACRELYLEAARHARPSRDAFQQALNEQKFEPSPDVASLPDEARLSMGNGFDSAEAAHAIGLFNGDELYGFKGAYVAYLKQFVHWTVQNDASKPITCVVVGDEAPMTIHEWLVSEQNRGSYPGPPAAFQTSEDGAVEQRHYHRAADRAPYTRAEVEQFMREGEMPGVGKDQLEAARVLWERLSRNEDGVAWVDRSPSLPKHPLLPNLGMFEPSWPDASA